MNYEQHLDEVTTLIFERFGLSEDASVKLVMRAQADGYFSEHDDDPSLCTQLRAEQDAKRVFKEYGKPAPAAPSGGWLGHVTWLESGEGDGAGRAEARLPGPGIGVQPARQVDRQHVDGRRITRCGERRERLREPGP